MMDRQLRGILTSLLLVLVFAGPSSSRAAVKEKLMVPVREGAVETSRPLSGNLRVDLFGLDRLSPSAPTMQQAFLRRLDAVREPYVFGIIAACNTPSLKTASRVGRRVVEIGRFVSLAGRHARRRLVGRAQRGVSRAAHPGARRPRAGAPARGARCAAGAGGEGVSPWSW